MYLINPRLCYKTSIPTGRESGHQQQASAAAPAPVSARLTCARAFISGAGLPPPPRRRQHAAPPCHRAAFSMNHERQEEEGGGKPEGVDGGPISINLLSTIFFVKQRRAVWRRRGADIGGAKEKEEAARAGKNWAKKTRAAYRGRSAAAEAAVAHPRQRPAAQESRGGARTPAPRWSRARRGEGGGGVALAGALGRRPSYSSPASARSAARARLGAAPARASAAPAAAVAPQSAICRAARPCLQKIHAIFILEELLEERRRRGPSWTSAEEIWHGGRRCTAATLEGARRCCLPAGRRRAWRGVSSSSRGIS